MIEMALRLTQKGRKVAIYSLEMSKKQIYLRMLANLMNLDLSLLKTGRIPANRREEMNKHKEFLKSIYVDDTRAVSADYITDSMRRVKRTRGLDVVMVDYLQDVKEPGEQNDNGGSALARVCRKLRKGAQEFDCAMFGLSQVTRGVEERKDKRPLSSDLAGSTGIETSADVIAMLYREDYYDPTTEKKDVMEINFCKQRNGQVGKVELIYAKKYQQLRPLSTGRY
jgi:replicative DNA helicase